MATDPVSDADVTSLGKHCALPECNDLDFLPIRCPHCQLQFCRHHAIPPSKHQCNSDPSLEKVKGKRFVEKFNDLLPDSGRSSGGGVKERNEKETERKRKHEEAQKVLLKNFGRLPSASLVSDKKAAKPRVDSPTIKLMKLKQTAKPADPRKGPGDVRMEDRIYFHACFLERKEMTTIMEMQFWVSGDTTAGKVLDLLAVHFKLENKNNDLSNPTKLLTLATPGEPSEAISTSRTLKQAVANGSTLWLIRG